MRNEARRHLWLVTAGAISAATVVLWLLWQYRGYALLVWYRVLGYGVHVHAP
jgi:hypothetical protein